jgi:DnaJ-class molecular chaperone
MTTNAASPPEGYAYETCGLCRGAGKGALGPEEPCPPCKATGKVLVHQPPIECPRCKGTGRAPLHEEYISRLCLVCRGSGWAMTLPA